MAGAALELRSDIHGDKAIERRLAKMLRGAEDREPLMDEIGAIMVASTQQRFEDQRGPDGVAWVPSERALAEGGQTLIDRGILFGSLTYNADNDQVEWGSNMVYAGIHQHGGEAGRGGATKLPARPYLGIDAGDAIAIEDATVDYLEELMQ